MSGINETLVASARTSPARYRSSPPRHKNTTSSRALISVGESAIFGDGSLATLHASLLAERADRESLQMELVRLGAELSRRDDDRSTTECKVLRLESNVSSLTEEIAEAASEVRKARTEADHFRRAHSEMSMHKAEIAAIRDTLQSQLVTLDRDFLDVKSSLKGASEQIAQQQRRIEGLHSENQQLQQRNAAFTVERTRCEAAVQEAQAARDAALHRAGLVESVLGADMGRLAQYFRRLVVQIRSSSSTADAGSDSLMGATEDAILENARSVIGEHYNALHAAIREAASAMRQRLSDCDRQARECGRLAAVDEALGGALGEVAALSKRLSTAEAQAQRTHTAMQALDKDLKAARSAIERLVHAALNGIEGRHVVVPSGGSVLTHVDEAEAVLRAVAAEVKAFRDGDTELQREVRRLHVETEEMRSAHAHALDVQRGELTRDFNATLDDFKASCTGELAAAYERRLSNLQQSYDDASLQRDDALRAITELRAKVLQEQHLAGQERVIAENLQRQLSDAHAAAERDQAARKSLERDYGALRDRLELSHMPHRGDRCDAFEALLVVLQAFAGAAEDAACAAAGARALARVLHVQTPPGSLYRLRPRVSSLLRFRVGAVAVLAAGRLRRLLQEGKTRHRSLRRGDVPVCLPLRFRVAAEDGRLPAPPRCWRRLERDAFLLPAPSEAKSPSHLIGLLLDQIRAPLEGPHRFGALLSERLADGLNALLLDNGRGHRPRYVPASAAPNSHHNAPNASRCIIHSQHHGTQGSAPLAPLSPNAARGMGRNLYGHTASGAQHHPHPHPHHDAYSHHASVQMPDRSSFLSRSAVAGVHAGLNTTSRSLHSPGRRRSTLAAAANDSRHHSVLAAEVLNVIRALDTKIEQSLSHPPAQRGRDQSRSSTFLH